METLGEKRQGGWVVYYLPVFCQFSAGRCVWNILGGSPEVFEEAFRNDEPDTMECCQNDNVRQQAQSWAFLLKAFQPQRCDMYEVTTLKLSVDLPASRLGHFKSCS